MSKYNWRKKVKKKKKDLYVWKASNINPWSDTYRIIEDNDGQYRVVFNANAQAPIYTVTTGNASDA